jgi:hypothetical protein
MKAIANKRWIGLGMTLLILAACAPAAGPIGKATEAPRPAEPAQEETDAPPPQLNLPRMGKAPEITNERWINTDEPLTLASQRGNVVLLEFWTFG